MLARMNCECGTEDVGGQGLPSRWPNCLSLSLQVPDGAIPFLHSVALPSRNTRSEPRASAGTHLAQIHGYKNLYLSPSCAGWWTCQCGSGEAGSRSRLLTLAHIPLSGLEGTYLCVHSGTSLPSQFFGQETKDGGLWPILETHTCLILFTQAPFSVFWVI